MMHILHEAVKMRPRLFLDRNRVKKHIHQEAFPASDATPEVEPSSGLVATKQSKQRALVPVVVDQYLAKAIELIRCL